MNYSIDYFSVQLDFFKDGMSKTEFFNKLVSITKPREPVLDVGCGLGFLEESLTKNGFSCVGVDVNEPALGYAKNSRGCRMGDFILASAEALSYKTRSTRCIAQMC